MKKKERIWDESNKLWVPGVGWNVNEEGYCTCNICHRQREKEKQQLQDILKMKEKKEEEKGMQLPDELFEIK